MPRRPLLLIVLASVVCLGIAVDLGWRHLHNSRPAVAAGAQVPDPLEELGLEGALLPNEQAWPEMRERVEVATRLGFRPQAAAERLSELTAGRVESAPLAQETEMREATAITVNGLEVVAVADAGAARQVVEQILAEYRETVLHDATEVEELTFQETVDWKATRAPADQIRTVEQAINVLRLGTDKLVTYTIESGDTAWDIAGEYDLTTDRLARANPGVDLEMLQIGQQLTISYKEPYVHTRSVSQRVAEEGIPFAEEIIYDPELWPWQYEVVTPGQWGTRVRTLREHREDGQLVKTEVLDTRVTAEPKRQVARVGTKQVPAMGSGTMVFPVVGELTSYFGPRWGSWHDGIDIAAPTGTPVLAADSGMVVFRGWDGSYGNAIRIDHGGGQKVTLYAHLSGYNVQIGQAVNKGDVIGYVGNTGYSTGPHLHFEVQVDGDAVNPLNYYP